MMSVAATVAVKAVAVVTILSMLPLPVRTSSDDFDQFNKIFENASILIPEEFQVSEQVAFADLNINIRNIKCYDFFIGDVTVDHEQQESNFVLNLGVAKLDLTCEMDYDYFYGMLRGDGWVQIQTDDSDATSNFVFKTPYSRSAPTDSFVDSCYSNVNIKRIDFEEDFVSEVVEIFQGLIRNTMETAIGDKICEQLLVAGEEFTDNMVDLAQNQLEPYLVNLGENFTDPLHDERNMILPNDLKTPVNLQDTDGHIGTILKYFDNILGTSVTDSTDENDLAINVFLRSFLLNEDRSFRVDSFSIATMMDPVLFKGHDQITEYVFTLNEISLYGLDSITRINSFRNIGRNTIQNQLTWKTLTVEFEVELELQPSTMDDAILIDPTSLGISERFKVDFTIDNVDVEASLLLLLDEDIIENMKLGPLFYTEHLLPCLLSIVHDIKVSGLDVDPTFINSGPRVTDFFLDTGINRVITDAVEAVFSMYKGSLHAAIPNMFQTRVRDLINTSFIDAYKSDGKNVTCPQVQPLKEGFIDFRKFFDFNDSSYGDLPPYLKTLLTKELLAVDTETKRLRINEAVVAPLTAAQSGTKGTILFPLDLVSFFMPKDLTQQFGLESLGLRIFDPKIENIDTIGMLELFEPITGEAFMLNNTMTFVDAGQKPLRFSFKLHLSLEDGGNDKKKSHDEVELSLELADVNMIVSTMTKISEEKLLNFPLRDIFDLNCWLATIPPPLLDSHGVRVDDSEVTASISDLATQIGSLNVKADCIDCSSPRMIELTNLLSSQTTQNETTQAANALLNYLTELMQGDSIQVQIDRILNDANLRCPHSLGYVHSAPPLVYDTSVSMRQNVFLGALALASIITVFLIILGVKYIVQRRHRKWLMKLPQHQIKKLSYQQRSEINLEDMLNSTTSSMFRSPDIPRFVRFMIPVIIILNIVFFISGHLSLGATVNIEFEMAGEKFTINNLLELSLGRSIVDVWKAGGRELAILLLIFSGVWPYTKLLISLWLWFTSPSSVSISRRGSILLWLNWLTKWSTIDIFFLVIAISAFRLSIQSPDTAYLPDDFYAIEMVVIPLWGLYSNIIAQLISQISSHLIVFYHRQIVKRGSDRLKKQYHDPENVDNTVELQHTDPGQEQSNSSTSFEDISVHPHPSIALAPRGLSLVKVNDTSESSLSIYQFSRPHRGETEKLLIRSYVNILLPLCALSVAICVIGGCILTNFSLEYYGMLGLAVKFGEVTVDHSIFSMIRLMLDQASYLGTIKDYLGLIALSLLLISTILFVPIIQSVALLYQWFATSTISKKRKIAVRLEILQAWQFLDVYLIALFVSSWQLNPISSFMINAYCDNLSDTFAQMVYYGVLKDEDAQCFSVSARIEKSAFILTAGVILLSFLSSFVCKAMVQHLYDERNLELQQIQGKRDFNNVSLDEIELASIITNTGIRPPPVFFTDSFRWMLKTADGTSSSARTLHVDEPGNNHWSLPEAIAVTDNNSHSNGRFKKGTIVSDLDLRMSKKEMETPASIGNLKQYASRDNTNKRSHYKSHPCKNGLHREAKGSLSSLDERSMSESESLAYSLNTMGSIERLSPRSLRKAPPPVSYRL